MSMMNKALTFSKYPGLHQNAICEAQRALSLVEEWGVESLSNQATALLQRIMATPSIPGILESTSSQQSITESPKIPITTLRDSAATALKRGLWEAATTYLEKLLQQGEPVETVAPDLITALLNAHETVSPHTVTRIETLLAQLDSAGHTALATPLRNKLTAKLAASQPKKPWWKFGR